MIHTTTYDQSVCDAFDVGHNRYIETATGIKHMYFLLGNDTKPIQYGMRCKDYLQEIFLCKRFKKCKTSNMIYGFKLRGVKNATRLYLKYPDKNMSEYKDNIYRCINYINTTYGIGISVAVLDSYVELRMPLNWFTDKINPVQASVISTLLRSCMIWQYDELNEIMENLDDLEDEYESAGIFPDKDWNGKSNDTLKFLTNTKAQKVLGRWDFCNQYYRKDPNITYHNRSGWVSCFTFMKRMKIKEDVLDLLEKMTPSTAVSDPCIVIDENTGKALCSKLIKNRKDLDCALSKINYSIKPSLIFNSALLHSETSYSYDNIFTDKVRTIDYSIQYSKVSLSYSQAVLEPTEVTTGAMVRPLLLDNYDKLRLSRVMNSLGHESYFSSNNIIDSCSALKTSAKTECFKIFKKQVLSNVKSSRALAILDRLDVIKKVYNYYKS